MDKKTQMIIGIVAVAGVAYFLLNKNTSKKEKVFANLRGPINQGPLGPNRPAEPCSSGSCIDGRCTVNTYGPNGQIMSTMYYTCSGSGTGIRVGTLQNPF